MVKTFNDFIHPCMESSQGYNGFMYNVEELLSYGLEYFPIDGYHHIEIKGEELITLVMGSSSWYVVNQHIGNKMDTILICPEFTWIIIYGKNTDSYLIALDSVDDKRYAMNGKLMPNDVIDMFKRYIEDQEKAGDSVSISSLGAKAATICDAVISGDNPLDYIDSF